MTIKKRMIVTNILMIAVPVVLSFIAGFFMRIILWGVFEALGLPFPDEAPPQQVVEHMPFMYLFFLGQMVIILGIFFASNMFFTRRLVRQIMAEHEKYENNRKILIAGISHDLRTPLTVIKAYLEGLETGVADTPEKQKKYRDTITAKANDLEKIINQLFLFSKLDIGDLPMNLQNIEVGKFIQDLTDDLTDEYKQKGILLEIENLADDSVRADVLWLHNVFVNIFENSAKYKNKDSGKVIISAVRVKGINGKAAMEIHLCDDGPGVPPETLDKLFDVFYRLDSSRSTQGQRGSGLGLAISSKMVQHMGGTIRAELGESGGLAIVISFPIVP